MQGFLFAAVSITSASTVLGVPPSFTPLDAEHGVTGEFVATNQDGYMWRMAGGAAVGDFNGDGFQDFFVVSDATNPDRLFLNDGDGTFTEAGASWGLDVVHRGIGCSAGDYDGDGDLDVYATSFGPSDQPAAVGKQRLYRNDNGTFTEVAAQAGVNTTSTTEPDGWGSTFHDYDLDGDLDLFVAGWQPLSGGNRLFRNDGDGTFTDVTESAFDHGINFFTDAFGDDASVHGFSPRFADMNGDLHPELLLSADFGTSRYFVNNGDGTFTNFTGYNGAGEDTNGMGNAVGDFNGDGMLDWYVSSIFFEDFRTGARNGNKLYWNQSDVVEHNYVEVSDALKCQDGGWGWGSVAVDLNHDRLLDIAETNGWPDPEWENEQAYLYMCLADGSFKAATNPGGIIHPYQGRSLVTIDIENDGDMDIVIIGPGAPLSVYRNEIDQSPDTNWLKFFFDTTPVADLAPQGYGTRIEVTAGDETRIAYMDGGCSFNGTSEKSVHFGLADLGAAEAVRVLWPNGDVTNMPNVGANQTRTIVAGGGPADFDADGLVTSSDLATLIALWGSGNPAADLDGDGVVGAGDLATLIASWG